MAIPLYPLNDDRLRFELVPNAGKSIAVVYRLGEAFRLVDDPQRFRGVRPDEIWIFGTAVYEKDRDLLEVVLPVTMTMPKALVHRIQRD